MNETMKLSELNGLVRQVLNGAFPQKIWVIAEISEMKINRTGHCYIVLVEKDTITDTVVAQARATIWSYVYRMLKPYFETTTGQPLIEGLKVLVQVSVEFHELYGFSLNIYDIDPTYTLGDLAKRKTEIINRLLQEGVFDMNREAEFPEVPQKIAVISSETAAGYQDFINQLKNNQAGYVFYTKLFPSVMQGPQTEASIIRALDKIFRHEDFFDVVVIIRGGGSQFDLSCFDNYNIAYHVTQFPIPVITGIGHEKDNSIVDLVAHTRLKTPTAVAEFLIGALARFDLRLEETEADFFQKIYERLDEAKDQVERLSRLSGPLIRGKISRGVQNLSQKLWETDHMIKMAVTKNYYLLAGMEEKTRRNIQQFILRNNKILDDTGGLALSGLKMMIPERRDRLDKNISSLNQLLSRKFTEENHRLKLSEQKNYYIDPIHILARGYSITTHNGSVLKDPSVVKPEDIIRTTLYEGILYSRVLENEPE